MSRISIRCFILFTLTLVLPLFSMMKAPGSSLHITSDTAGVRTLKYQDTKRERPIVIELWYPTNWTGPFDEPSDRIWVHPKEIRNAPISAAIKKSPLIVMSHGHGGDRRDRSWLADQLVRCGFIVASVEHFGNSSSTFNLLASLRFWERAHDISFAIDRLIEEPLLIDRIDRERIGFVGYSLGGMTGLGLAGATVGSTEQIIAAISGKVKEIKPEMLAKVDLSEAKKPMADPRIRAMLLICPASFVYSAESLKNIKIPVGLVAAINDEVLPFHEHASLIIKNLIPAKLKMMRREISHYAFLNRVSEEGKKFIQKHFYNDPPCCDRISIHLEVGTFAVDFFREHL